MFFRGLDTFIFLVLGINIRCLDGFGMNLLPHLLPVLCCNGPGVIISNSHFGSLVLQCFQRQSSVFSLVNLCVDTFSSLYGSL